MLDLLSLRKGILVESFVIDMYFSMLNFREHFLSEEYLGRKKAYYYNSALYYELKYCNSATSKNILKEKLLNYTSVFIPINTQNHWILCEIKLHDDKDNHSILITSYDSKILCNVNQNEILEILGKWIKTELNILNQYTDISPVLKIGKSIQQEKLNNVDCGVIVMLNVLFLSFDDDVYYEKFSKSGKANLNEKIIPNARYIFAMDIERGYIQDFRLNSYYKIKCHPFRIKNSIKIKNVNKDVAELCAFVEGSKEKPFILFTEGDGEDVVINNVLNSIKGQQQQQKKSSSIIATTTNEQEEISINKWKFASYKAQIKLLSCVFPHYAVLPEFFKIETKSLEQSFLETLRKMEHEKDKDLKVVAQHSNEMINDKKRLYYHPNNSHEKLNKLPESIKTFLSEIEKLITSVISNLLPDIINAVDISILYSKNGCGKQKTHTDYKTETLECRGFAEKSFFGLFAMMDHTSIIVHDKQTLQDREIAIPKGSLFIGRGDLIHAGNKFENDNVRLHFYWDYEKYINRNDRETHFDFEEEDDEKNDEEYINFINVEEKEYVL
jgi:hypothetical protein